MDDLFDELKEPVETPEARDQVRETMRVAMAASRNAGPFDRIVRGFGREAVAEALLGNLLFGIPMLVERGTLEVGEFLAGRSLCLAGIALVSVALVVAILYVADVQDVRVVDPLFGALPRRLVGVLGVSLCTAAVAMSAWGRVDWTQPWVACE